MTEAAVLPVETFITSTLDGLGQATRFRQAAGLRLGKAKVNLLFGSDPASTGLVERLLAALDRSIVAQTSFPTANFDLYLSLGENGDIGKPPREWPFETADRDSFHRVHWAADKGLALTSDEQTGVWNLADLRGRRGLVWISDVGRLPDWEFAAPFRHHAHWIALSQASVITHAAALVDGARALLLTGPGGSGKSTTTVAALASGRSVLAEDLAWVEIRPDRLRVNPLYRTFKVTDAARRNFRFVEEFVQRFPHQRFDKTLVYCEGDAKQAEGCDIRALYCLSAKFAAATGIEPCPRGLAFRLLAPSTIFLMRTAAAETATRLRSVIDRLPVFHVTLGACPQAAVDAIFEHLRGLDGV